MISAEMEVELEQNARGEAEKNTNIRNARPRELN